MSVMLNTCSISVDLIADNRIAVKSIVENRVKCFRLLDRKIDFRKNVEVIGSNLPKVIWETAL